MFFLLDLGGIAIFILGIVVGLKFDTWFGKNHRNLHSVYRHLGVETQEDAIAKIDSLK
jgi:hypothetical protein